MGVSLSKGGNVSLKKAATDAGIPNADTMTKVRLGLGWNPRTTTGVDFDLDAQATVVGVDGKVLSDKHFVFFNNLETPDGAVKHLGDNLTGEGEGDDEQIVCDLAALTAAGADKVVFTVNIYEGDVRKQNFGQVAGAFIRVVDDVSNTEITRFDLSEDAATQTLLVFGELYNNGGDWKFRAKGDGYDSGLAGLAKDYGVNV